MVAINIEYRGDLHCKVAHGPSGTDFTTDAPKDSHGRGESFSPTDLVAAGLGSCILTVMGIMARSIKLDISGATAIVDKEMVNAPVRKIQKLIVKIHVPQRLDDEQKRRLEDAACNCPVHRSMHPDVQVPIYFTWG